MPPVRSITSWPITSPLYGPRAWPEPSWPLPKNLRTQHRPTRNPANYRELDKIELPKTFDRDAFLASLDAAIDEFNATRVGTFDAAGAFDPEAGSFTLTRALSNRKLDKDAIDRAALVAVSTLAARVELTERSFTPLAGGATEQELQHAIDRANELIGTNVNLKMGGSVVSTLDGAQLAQWITFDEALNPTLNTEPVGQWAARARQDACRHRRQRADLHPPRRQDRHRERRHLRLDER